MSYQQNREGKHAELSGIASAIAAELPEWEHAHDCADYRERATIRHKTRPVWFEIYYAWDGKGERLKVIGTRPPRWPNTGFSTPGTAPITCSKNRPARALAADISRRFLADYVPAYVKAYRAAHQAEQKAKSTDFEREQIRQAFGGDWEKQPHHYYGDECWTEQNTSLQIKWDYRGCPRFSITMPTGEQAQLMAYALRHALDTIQKHSAKKSA
jgi:hypothetical protein